MRIAELTASHVRIPLKRRVTHASFSRESNDTLVVRCRLSTGEVGWGEGLPRSYVTGETLEAVWDLLASTNLTPFKVDFRDIGQVLNAIEAFQLPRVPGLRDCYGHSARCAMELALLDAFLQHFQISLREVIPLISEGEEVYDPRGSVRYSGVITNSTLSKAMLTAATYRLTGFSQCKLKVGSAGADDPLLVRRVRLALGRNADLRIDANEAWRPENLLEKVSPLLGANLSGIEQPVPHSQIGMISKLRENLPVPVILDESVCSLSDAQHAVDGRWGDVFNIRLSKCGGFIPSVRLVLLARRAGLGVQLGCQVGETGILSAAGRHFATGISGLRYVEGSFDRFLVRERLTTQDLTFGWGGSGAAIDRPGLGVTIDEAAVERVTQKSQKLL